MALKNYKGGPDAKPDFEVQEEGYRLGRIKGDWEDKLHSATPGHSERNWNHGAQMTESLGTTDGNIDSQQEVAAVAKWLNENSPGGDDSQPEPEPEAAPPEPEPSPKIVEAKERVKEYEDYRWSGEHADDLFYDSMDTTTDTPVDPNKYELDLSNQARDSLLTSTATPEPAIAQGSDVGQRFKDEYMKGMAQSKPQPTGTNTQNINTNSAPVVQGNTKWM